MAKSKKKEKKKITEAVVVKKAVKEDLMVQADNSKTTFSSMLTPQAAPTVTLSKKFLFKSIALTKQANEEVGWLGFVKKQEDGSYYIYDAIVLEQEVTAINTDICEEDLNKLAFKLMETDPDKFNDVRCWCHSHVNMGVSPSGQDEKTFTELYSNCQYFIRIIMNKKGNMKIDVADCVNKVIFNDVAVNVEEENNPYAEELLKAQNELTRVQELYDNVDLSVFSVIEEEMSKELKEKVKSQTRKKGKTTSSCSGTYNYGYGGYYTDYSDYYNGYYNDSYTAEDDPDEEERNEIRQNNNVNIAGMAEYLLTHHPEEILDYIFLLEESLYVDEWKLASRKDKLGLLADDVEYSDFYQFLLNYDYNELYVLFELLIEKGEIVI